MFRTKFEKRERIFTNCGSPVKILYKTVFDKTGKLKLIENGKKDLYNEIQSHADSVDLLLVLKKYASGDVTALNKKEGAYGDFTQMPSTFADMLNVVNNAEQDFYKLSPEIRAKFNNSFAQYVAMLDNPTKFAELLGFSKTEAPVTVAKEEPKAQENEN